MADLMGIIGKLRHAVQGNPDAVRGGLDKVEGIVNTKTGGKYSDKIAQGRRSLDGAIGVPTQARDSYRDGRADDVTSSGPVPPPAPVDRPGPIDRDGSTN